MFSSVTHGSGGLSQDEGLQEAFLKIECLLTGRQVKDFNLKSSYINIEKFRITETVITNIFTRKM